MPTRRPVGAALLAALGLGVGLVPGPARGQQIHRHTFAGKQVSLVRGDANVRADEKEHDISANSFHSQPSSEHLALTFADVVVGDAAFVHYHYPTPPAPVSPVLTAGVWVKATKPGVQLRARVVFPKEPDPANPQAPLTMLVVGKTYDRPRQWDKLTVEDVPALVGKHLPAVQAKIGRPVNDDGAYVDRLVLNVYTGPGPVDIWVDDLDIGPVVRSAEPPAEARPPAVTTGQNPGKAPPEPPAAPGRLVEQRGGQLMVDGKAHFFRAIRHTGTPLHVLRAAGFDALWLPPDATDETIADAAREGWFVIPSAPPVGTSAVSTGPDTNNPFDVFRRKFASSDVLFWDLGGGLTDAQEEKVRQAWAEIRNGDRRRPLGGDLWDGFGAYSQYLDVVGAHRWPLFTSLDLPAYKEWLGQRRRLVGGRPVFWTWVQNHTPDWYLTNLATRPVAPGATPPAADPNVGPHPEQVRQLAYLSIASGCRGLGFWSDRSLSTAAGGADRLQGAALLNAELEMLGPLLISAGVSGNTVDTVKTSHPHVKGYLLNANAGRQKGLVLLLVWAGPGDQYVPAQGAVAGLKVWVPTVSDGYDPWLVTPAGVECLKHEMRRVPGGVELTVPEFDTALPVVFTDDVGPNGLVVWWQDFARRYGRQAARWALDLVHAEYEKVRAVHIQLASAGAEVRGADRLLEETHRYYQSAQQHHANEQYERAYKDAARALRPLRVLMRDHWRLATAGLDVPTASPFAVSYATLPQHWELAREVAASRPGPSALPHGAFEPPSGVVPKAGIPVARVPGWSARASELPADRVEVGAGVVPADGLADPPANRDKPPAPRTVFSPSRPIPAADEGYVPPAPELGKGVLKLHVRSRPATDRSGKVVGAERPLERTFLAVDGPPVRFPPGTLVRISGWVKVPVRLGGTADGALLYDDAGGEPLAVRVLETKPDPGARLGVWKQYHLYRRVPASGQIAVTVALTGTGEAYFDDLRIEPLVFSEEAAEAARRGGGGWPAAGPGVVPAGHRAWPEAGQGPVAPAGGPPR
jgi:hypothetical protein